MLLNYYNHLIFWGSIPPEFNVLLSVNEKLCDMNEQDNFNAKTGF